VVNIASHDGREGSEGALLSKQISLYWLPLACGRCDSRIISRCLSWWDTSVFHLHATFDSILTWSRLNAIGDNPRVVGVVGMVLSVNTKSAKSQA